MRDKEIVGLWEAYLQVHQPKEQMNKEVENWVNSLIEEGYDLSEYTWDDMYEIYINENRAAARDPEGYEENERRGQSSRQRRMNDPHKGINSPAFQEFMNRQMGRPKPKKKKIEEETDLFDAILEHLVAEGYADTNESALVIMANMSEEWRESIVEELEQLDEGYKSFPHEKVKAKVKKLKTDRESLGKKPLTGKSDSEISDTLNKMERSRNRETRLGLQSNIAHSFLPKQKEKSNRNRPESEKRSKTVKSQKSFGNRLRRADGQGIQDSYDIYDLILSHLLDEGYAEAPEAAETIMVHMSEEWRESIVEELEQLDEISLKTKMKAYAATQDPEADYQYGSKVHAQGDRIRKAIVKKHGEKAGKHADAHADSKHWGRIDPRTSKPQGYAKPRIEKNRTYRTTKKGTMHGQDQAKLKSDLIKRRNQG